MSVAVLIADLRRRDVRLRAVGDALDLDFPKGALSEADLEALRRRKGPILAYLRWETRGRAPIVLSPAWPGPASWQQRYAVEGRHPLVCPTCGARTLRRTDDGRLACCAGCRPGAEEGR